MFDSEFNSNLTLQLSTNKSQIQTNYSIQSTTGFALELSTEEKSNPELDINFIDKYIPIVCKLYIIIL